MRLPLGCVVLVVACGGDSTGIDGGNDAANDGITNDVTADVATNDAANDAGTSDAAFGDGGLAQGSDCNPNDNLCLPTLLCCSEPTHNFDGGPLSHDVCEPPSNGKCPLLP